MFMSKSAIYDEVRAQISAVIEGETSAVARMATVSCLLDQAFDHFFWTGFYVVDPLKPKELVVGPYQGSLGCLRIPFGQGVCGHAAKTGQSVIVPDVHAFDGHIACDPRSNSEIVVPVFTPEGSLFAVLDVDSEKLDAFDDQDQKALENICQTLLDGAVL